MSTSTTAPETVSRRAWAVLGLTSFGQMMTTFSGSALNVGFPVIEADLDVERTVLVWSISGYSIASAALLLIAGRAADRVGGRKVFLSGVALFTLGAALAFRAPGVEVLIAGRVIQGLGSAAMIPSSLSLALHEFPYSRRSFAVAIWGAVAAIAGASGPPVGAAIIELAGWRWVFGTIVPIGVLVLVVGRWLLRDPPPAEKAARFDFFSSPLASVAVGLVILALLESDAWGLRDRRTIACVVTSAVLLAVVARRSNTHPAPLIDPRLLRNRRFVVASSMTTVYNAATSGYWLAAPLFLQGVRGWSVLESGFGIIAGPLTHMVLAHPMGRLAERGEHRRLMVLGALLSAAATLGLAVFVTETSSFVWTFLPFTVLLGAGGAMAWPVFTSGALVDVPPSLYGGANGVNLTMRTLGGSLGVAVVVAAIGNSDTATMANYRAAWIIGTVGLVVCAAIIAVAYPERSPEGQ